MIKLSKFNIFTIFIFILVFSIMTTIYIFIIKNFYIKNLINPPIVNVCPEFWDISYNNDNNQNDIVCINSNKKNLGNYNNSSFSIYKDVVSSDNKFSFNLLNQHYVDSLSYLCDRHKFSKKYSISWNGITNNTKLDSKCNYE